MGAAENNAAENNAEEINVAKNNENQTSSENKNCPENLKKCKTNKQIKSSRANKHGPEN